MKIDDKNILYAEVAVKNVDKTLFYSFPKDKDISIGSEVKVKLVKREVKGWVIGISKKIPKELLKKKKDIEIKQILEYQNVFHPNSLSFFKWISKYYGSNLAKVISTAIPNVVKPSKIKVVEISKDFLLKIEKEPDILKNLKKKAPKQFKIIKTLLELNTKISLRELADNNSTRAAINSLKEKNFILIKDEIKTLETRTHKKKTQKQITLNKEQDKALTKIIKSIDSLTFSPILLHGITGSGKTEVYIRAIKHVLKNHSNALIIVPEISLTPQLIDQFKDKLEEDVAVLHSQINQSLRWQTWEKIYKGEYRVALGARSSIFSPFKKLSLIIVDEEHESSYKQNEGLRYHGRDLAIKRAQLNSCPVILGSATPSFESLVNSLNKKYSYIEMTKRATKRNLPKIEIVNLLKFRKKDMPSENISPILFDNIKKTLEKKNQVIILYNRRGFSSYLECTSCGENINCPYCSVTLTFHKGKNRLICHHCQISQIPPKLCPICRNEKTTKIEKENSKVGELKHRGGGTEKIIDELETLFPEANLLRMDKDTTSYKDAYRKILKKMKKKEADILVGTQMIAKGHDLPGVTLVAIVDADVGLNIADFRASEKSYQLIVQAAGRAGRGEDEGKVIVQTRKPNHPTIVAASTGRFKAFAKYELQFRKLLSYPPYGRLMRIIISSPDAKKAKLFSLEVLKSVKFLCEELTKKDTSIQFLKTVGPSKAPLEKLKNQYRFHMLIKSNSPQALSLIALSLKPHPPQLKIDIDPTDML